MSLGTPGPAPSIYEEPPAKERTESLTQDPKRRRRWPWVAFVALLIGAGVAGVVVAQLTNNDSIASEDDSAPDEPSNTDSSTIDASASPTRQFVAIDDAAFTEATGSDGVIFGSVANSFGLTMVGAYGDGESLSEQHSVVWTLEPGTIRMQREFDPASQTRLWSIGVLDGQQFLAVGEHRGAGGSDGAAWVGQNARILTASADPSFSGPTADRLRVATANTGSATSDYLVGGTRDEDGTQILGLWEVDMGETSEDVIWSTVDLGSDASGIINDIATSQDVALAVGKERSGTRDDAVLFVRRGNGGWSSLIQPIPNAEFFGAAISGDRLIAVGEEGGPNSKRPFAIVSDLDGNAQFHRLPTRDDASGVARDVAVLASGRVIAVGDIAVDGGSRRGSVWELGEREELADDRWTTRASSELNTDTYTELWNINEFDDTVYLFGRTENAERRPAGGWVLTLPEG